MSLPSQIQKQVEEGNRIMAELTGAANSPAQDAAPAEASPPAASEPAAEGAFPSAVNDQITDSVTQTQQVEAQPDSATQNHGGEWEHKYKVLQGKYNKGVPRLTKEVGEMRDLLNQMTSQVQQLTAAPRPYELDPNAIAAEVEIRQEEREEFGDDLLDLVGRRAMQVTLPELRRIEARIEEIARGLVGVNSSVQVSEHEKFLQALDNAHKGWRKLNTDEGFLAWLEMPDGLSGVARKHLLEDAVGQRSVDRSLRFFTSYEAEHGIAPSPRRPAQQASAAQDTALEAMAAPGQGRPVTAPAPTTTADVWTRSDISRFYADVRKGAFKGREAERDRIEQAIIQAAAQNRVVQA